jgi:rare lipoprotein A
MAGLAMKKGKAPFWVGLTTTIGLAFITANCAQNPTTSSRSRSSEIGAFPQHKYGPASPRVVAEGDEVPKGGGRYMVGKPYTVAGRRYVPFEKRNGHSETGLASWYGEAFHGRKTANGEVFDRGSLSAAHRTMPLPSYARVTNMNNGRSIIVRVNDRGPFHANRVIDLSQRTADALDFRRYGVARVRVDYVGAASTAGSDDRRLMASLTTDGRPAQLDGLPSGVMVASAEPVTPSRVSAVPNQASAYSRDETQAAPSFAGVSRSAIQAASAPAQQETAPGQAGSTEALPRSAPLPPGRPFDLGTMMRPQIATGAPMQARPAPARVASATFFAEPEPMAARFVGSDPWAGLKSSSFSR